MTRPFFDTNILVYAFGTDERSVSARRLLERGGHVAVQSLNEFVRVVVGKQHWTWKDANEALAEVESLFEPPVAMDMAVHRTAIALAERYKLHVFDANIIAAAAHAGCDTFYSEDMHDGLLIEGQLRIVNAFAQAPR